MGVGQVVHGGGLVGAGDELDLGIIGSHLQHEGLKAVGVVDDQVAAGLGQLDIGVLAGGVLTDVPLDLPINGDALFRQGLGDGLLAADEVVGVALVVLVADADQANLDGLALGLAAGNGLTAAGGALAAALGAAAAGGQAQHHGTSQEQCKQFSLLHVQCSSF